MTFDIDAVRAQFPALSRQIAGQPAAFLDGPAGSQVPSCVMDAVVGYLRDHNANTHGAFVTSHESDAQLLEAGRAVADLIGCDSEQAIAFGPNMTTLTFAFSRALARTWRPGDEVIVTKLDHDANVSPWVLAARDAGATVRHLPFRPSDTTLDLDALAEALNERTRLVAVGAASNATGTINPLAQIAEMVHGVGAEVFVDAVHYAPHGLIDVAAWDCDYLVCSAYKFFGPHVAMLWGRPQRMATLPAYRVRPAGDELPDRWMTGTQNHEGIVGAHAAIDYLARLGDPDRELPRRDALTRAFAAIGAYERTLVTRLCEGLSAIDGVQIYCITDPARFDERAPTVSFTHPRFSAQEVAAALGERGIFVWDGNYYAVGVTEALGLEPEGMVRVGMLHYNTAAEVDRCVTAVAEL